MVRVRRRCPPKAHLANVKNVAAETGFYTIKDENGIPSMAIEHELSGLEGQGLAALRRIDETGMAPAVGTDDRELLCLYLAVQMVRTPRQRTGTLFGRDVTAYANGREVDLALMTEYLTRKHLGHTPRVAEAQGAWDYYHGTRAMNGGNDPTHDEAVAVTLSCVRECIPQYRARHWRLETSRKPIFLTSDAPPLCSGARKHRVTPTRGSDWRVLMRSGSRSVPRPSSYSSPATEPPRKRSSSAESSDATRTSRTAANRPSPGTRTGTPRSTESS